MKSIILSLFLTLTACLADAPSVSTNRWAGQYLGVLLSSAATCPERVEVDVWVYEDNSVLVEVYSFRAALITAATGTLVKGKFAVVFGDEGYILKGSIASHKAFGTLRPIVKGGGCSYTYSAHRRWKYGYDVDYDEP